MSHQLFFLSIFFHCFSLAAEDHPWSPQSFWDKIFSHFAISGPFSQPHSYLAFTLPLPPQTWSFANMTLPFLGAENWGSVWWDRKAHPQGQKTHVWSAVSELFYLNLPMALASWEGLSDTLSPHLSLFDYIVFHCFFFIALLKDLNFSYNIKFTGKNYQPTLHINIQRQREVI